MKKSWLGRFSHSENHDTERRADVAPALEPILGEDYDPRTRTLKWHRFMTMLEAEQSQGPNALLLINLTPQSHRMADAVLDAAKDVLPLLAQALRQAIREDDLVAHSDGYRFVVMLRGASQDVGQAVSARIQESVDDTIFITAAGVLPLEVAVEVSDLKVVQTA